MTIDVAVAIVVCLFGLFGMAYGAVEKLAHAAGLLLAGVAAKPLASKLTPLAAEHFHRSRGLVRVLVGTASFFLIYGIGSVVFAALFEKGAGEREGHPLDRAAGFVLGVLEGASVVVVMLTVILFFQKPIEERVGPFPAEVRQSHVVAFTRWCDIFGKPPPAVAKAEKLFGGEIEQAREVKAIAADPRLKKLAAGAFEP